MTTSATTTEDDSNQPIFSATNAHIPDCGKPPKITANQPRQYCAYLENGFGEQLIFVYDTVQEKGLLYHGDAGWEDPNPVLEGGITNIVMSQGERLWLQGCWLEATNAREYRKQERQRAGAQPD